MVPTRSFGIERRRAERFVVSLPVRLPHGRGTTRDASAAGLYVITDEMLSVGEHLEFTVTVPDPDHPEASPLRLDLKGRVVRLETHEAGTVGAGIALDEGNGHLARAS
jgi:hypothetical protein